MRDAQNLDLNIDERIKKLYCNCLEGIWKFEGRELLKQEKINSDNLRKVYEQGKDFFSVIPDEKLFKKIEEKKMDLEKWTNEFEKTIGKREWILANLEGNSLLILEMIEKLEEMYKELRINLKEEKIEIEMIKSWVEWIIKGKEIDNLMNEKRVVKYESVKELLDLGNSIEFPINLTNIGQRLKSVVNKCKENMESLKNFFEKKNKANTMFSNFPQRNENITRKKLLELNKMKPELIEAEELLEKLKADCLLNSESLKLQKEIENARSFYEKIKKFLIENEEKLKFISELTVAERNVIRSETTNYCQEIKRNISLGSSEIDNKMYIFELKFTGLCLLNGIDGGGTLEKWKIIVKLCEEMENYSEDWVNLIKQQISLAKKLGEKISGVKLIDEENRKRNLNNNKIIKKNNCWKIKELNEFVKKELINCKVLMAGDSKKYIEGLLIKGERLCRDIKEFKKRIEEKGEKPHRNEHEQLLNQMQNLPIDFEENEEFLEKNLNLFQELNMALGKVKRFLNSQKEIDPKISEILLEKYQNCPVFNVEAQHFLEDFQNAKIIMDEIQENLTNFEQNPQLLIEQEDILHLSMKFEEIKINFGGNYNLLKLNLWLLKVEFVKQQQIKNEEKKNEGGNNEEDNISGLTKITYKQLCSFLKEGYHFLPNSPENVEKIRKPIVILENLILSLEDQMYKIGEIKELNLLEKVAPNLFSFVDITEEIIEYKTELMCFKGGNKNAYEDKSLLPKFQINSPVKSPYEKYPGSFYDSASLKKFLGIENLTNVNPSILNNNNINQNERSNNKDSNKKQYNNNNPLQNIKKSRNLQSQFLNQAVNNNQQQIQRNIEGKRKIQPSNIYGEDFILYNKSYDNSNVVVNIDVNNEDEGFRKKQMIIEEINMKKKNKSSIDDKVNEEIRKNASKEMETFLLANSKFKNSSIKDLKYLLKLLENQIFGEFHSQVKKYYKETNIYRNFFEKIISFPCVSQKIVDKNFSLQTIQKLAKNMQKDPTLLTKLEQQAKSREIDRKQQQKMPLFSNPIKKIKKLPVENINKKPGVLLTNPNLTQQIKKKPSLNLTAKSIEEYDPLNTNLKLKSPVENIKSNQQINNKPGLDIKALFESTSSKEDIKRRIPSLLDDIVTNKEVPIKKEKISTGVKTLQQQTKKKLTAKEVVQKYERLSSEEEKFEEEEERVEDFYDSEEKGQKQRHQKLLQQQQLQQKKPSRKKSKDKSKAIDPKYAKLEFSSGNEEEEDELEEEDVEKTPIPHSISMHSYDSDDSNSYNKISSPKGVYTLSNIQKHINPSPNKIKGSGVNTPVVNKSILFDPDLYDAKEDNVEKKENVIAAAPVIPKKEEHKKIDFPKGSILKVL